MYTVFALSYSITVSKRNHFVMIFFAVLIRCGLWCVRYSMQLSVNNQVVVKNIPSFMLAIALIICYLKSFFIIINLILNIIRIPMWINYELLEILSVVVVHLFDKKRSAYHKYAINCIYSNPIYISLIKIR